MIRCAYCDSVTLALDLNGVDAHVCPLCGAVFARKNKNPMLLSQICTVRKVSRSFYIPYGRMIHCIGQSSQRRP